MQSTGEISPLRIANEAFMVAATIERCPRSMMLRELVMNALEAASGATDSEKRVVISAVDVDGTPKLRIWNTGRGLNAIELRTITDLSSSLFKTVGLVGNFGMGAKAAALTSNRHGLRYRSCRSKRVSEVILGERDGVYGRLRRPRPDGTFAEVVDVTDIVRAEGGHTLNHDWTEVVLLGNSPEQNTVLDPYAGDPNLGPHWVFNLLGKRFFRLPSDVELQLDVGTAKPGPFQPPLGSQYFDKVEEVSVEGGVVIRYAYREEDSQKPRPPIPTMGLGAVVYDDEVYALVEGQRWLLEAPNYGFTFAARRICITVELSRDYPVRPEQYRQFLRFEEGDQRQVLVGDFGELIRANIPGWLRKIIASMRPGEKDYLAEIKSDLKDLLTELGIEETVWQNELKDPKRQKSEKTDRPKSKGGTPPKPKPQVVPPEIIVIETEEQLAEKALGGRAARYYPRERQLFVNARYEAFLRLAAGLEAEFAAAADAETVRFVTRQAAEWALIGRLGRSLAHSLGKKTLGWNEDEVKAVQSPETMSLVIDDFTADLSVARRRVAIMLGAEERGVSFDGIAWRMSDAQRDAAALAQAEAELQRALSANISRLGQFYCQLARVHVQRRDFAAAKAALERGIATDPADAWCHYELAGVRLAEKDYVGAAEAAEAAFGLAQSGAFWLRRIEVATETGDDARARELLAAAIEEHPDFPWLHFNLSTLRMREGDLAGAAAAIERAIELKSVRTFVLRLAEIEQKRGNPDRARALLEDLLKEDPEELNARLSLARFVADQGDFAASIALIDEGLALGGRGRGTLLRTRSDIEMRRGNVAGALASANAACDADPTDLNAQIARARILIGINDLDGAEAAIADAARLTPRPHAGLSRMRAMIARQRGDYPSARKILEETLGLDRGDAWTYVEISNLAVAQGSLDSADLAMEEAARRMKDGGNFIQRRRSDIAFRRNDADSGWRWLEEAMAADPADPACRLEASARHLADGVYEKAREMAQAAVSRVRQPTLAMLRRLFEIESAQGDMAAARAVLDRAITLYPSEAYPWSELSKLLMATGDLPGAHQAAERALELKIGAGAS